MHGTSLPHDDDKQNTQLSLMILANGARQLVVQEALDSTLTSFVYLSWLTPMTNMGASAEGALMMTFLAPPPRCKPAFSVVVNTPVDSTTMSAPDWPHGILDGSFLQHHFNGVSALGSAHSSQREQTQLDEEGNAIAVDDDGMFLVCDLGIEFAVHGVVSQEVDLHGLHHASTNIQHEFETIVQAKKS